MAEVEREEAVADWGPPPGEVGIEKRSGRGNHEEEKLWWQPGNTGTFQIVGKQEVSPWAQACLPRLPHLLLGTC